MTRRTFKGAPPFLFRYRPPDEVKLGYLEGLLRENQIWASTPRGFADWNDCRAQINFNLTREETLRYWVKAFQKIGLTPEAASKQARDIVAGEAWKEPANHAKILQQIQGTLDNTGVICLTYTALDERMWSEYAGGNHGICLCFETSESPFSLTRYVNYVAELPAVRIDASSREQIRAFLLTKSSSYSWERERRFVDYDKGGGYKPISPWALQAIVLGSQVEASVKEEVVRLVARWKPHVMLFVVDASRSECSDLRLKPFDWPEMSTKAHITPPIQAHPRIAPTNGPKSSQLLGCLKSIGPEQHRPELSRRIGVVAAKLKVVELSQGRRTKEVVSEGIAAVLEAAELLREIVDRSGASIPGYDDVAVHLYKLVHATLISRPRPL